MREMKESGIRWVGKIPYTWKVDKNKHYFNLEKNIVGDKMNEYELLSLTKKGVIKKDENSIGGKVPESFETYQSVKKGQIVMCLFDLDVSAVFSGLSPYNGMISPAYKIYNCNKNMYNKYAKYWFECCFDGRKYKAYSKSLRYVVNTEDFGPIEIVVPPIEEQHKIADFLDKKVLEIDNIIEKTKRTIEDYKKYKRSLITEVVTKGLDKNVKMKDIEIDWIGEIPYKWNLARIKNVAQIFGRIGFKGYTQNDFVSEGEGAITLSPSNFNDLKMDYETCSYLSWSKYEESPEIQIKNGDILFVKTGSSYGKVCMVELLPMEATINPQMIVFKNIMINNLFLTYVLFSNYIQYQTEISVTGGTIPTMSQEKINNFRIVVPSDEEQISICNYISEKIKNIDKIIEKENQIIKELEEYKKSLIYEYVTGKKEVI